MRFWMLLALATALSCGDKDGGAHTDEPDTGPASDDTSASGEDTAPAGSGWAEMDRDQRYDYMAEVVLPTMQGLWADSPNPGKTISCTTCHGTDMVTVDYAMPNSLHPLDLDGPIDPDWDDFMTDTFNPKMVELLDADPYDEGTGSGFGCHGCHATP